ncbi:MAG: FAD-binding protein [Bacteroidetes bacterium]|nr:FAD-binding protein [Bacteroidota bacterium]MBS1649049.1 FAD-binding protein [Bacteroidota bacterium]
MPPTIINYGRTWQFTPKQIACPTNVEELKSIIKNAESLRPVGSKHSWSKGIITHNTLVSLQNMNTIQEFNFETLQIKVGAGITLKELIIQLELKGLALSNLGSIHAQTLAGAICTGTHGTGIGFQCLASQVESFEMVDGNGENHIFTKNNADFYALITGMGCCGIIHTITLNVVKTFQMHAITDTVNLDELIENLEQYVEKYDHFKFWWLPPSKKVIVFKNNRTEQKRNDSNFIRFIKDEVLSVALYRLLVMVGKWNRKKFIPSFNRFLTKMGGKYFERICKSYIGFLTPLPPIHRETEWAFNYAQAKPLLKKYKELMLNDEHTYNFVQEVRFSCADDFWLSPAYKQNTIWLPMYNMDNNNNWEAQRKKFETWAIANNGRPHWGKEADLEYDYLQKQYIKLSEFNAVIKKYDPLNKFANNWNKKFCK